MCVPHRKTRMSVRPGSPAQLSYVSMSVDGTSIVLGALKQPVPDRGSGKGATSYIQCSQSVKELLR